MKKNILFICASHGFEDGRVSQKEAVTLVKHGYRVSLCAQRGRWGYDDPVRMIDVDTGNIVSDWHNLSTPPRSTRLQRLGRLVRLYKICKREKPDLVVAHELESSFIAWLFKKFHHTPFVFDIHESFDDNIFTESPRVLLPIVKMLFALIWHMIVRGSAGITAVSDMNDMLKYPRKIGKPVLIIHNSPILDYFPFREEEGQPILIVHEGWLTYNRAAIQIVDALNILNQKHDFRLLLLGKISPDVEGPFKAKLKEYGLIEKVDLPGALPWREFGAVEARGQIGLVCSLRHPDHVKSLSNKVYNYMACGLAVVCLEESATAMIVKDSNSGLCVDTTDSNAIANALIWLIEHPDKRRQMARNGRRAIEDKYGWHIMEKQMVEFYGRI